MQYSIREHEEALGSFYFSLLNMPKKFIFPKAGKNFFNNL